MTRMGERAISYKRNGIFGKCRSGRQPFFSQRRLIIPVLLTWNRIILLLIGNLKAWKMGMVQ